jgi:preprotein translocase subunit YajC
MKKEVRKGEANILGGKLVAIILIVLLVAGFFFMIWRIFNAV